MLHVSNLLVGGTGLVYAWMLYLVKPTDPYAVVNHPWQPQTQHLHILVAPLLGLHRRHGLAASRLGAVAAGAGGAAAERPVAGLTPGADDRLRLPDPDRGGRRWRKIWVGVHLAAVGLWLLGYLAHQALGYRRYRRLTSDQR